MGSYYDSYRIRILSTHVFYAPSYCISSSPPLPGLRSGFINESEYRQLAAVESIDDFKTVLQDTDYVTALQGIGTPKPSTIREKCLQKFVSEFDWLRANAVGQLAAFMDMIANEFLLQNCVGMISAIIKGTPVDEVMEHAHPLGRSPYLKSMLTFDREDSLEELYRVVLIDMPVAKYFSRYFEHEFKANNELTECMRSAFSENDTNVVSDRLRKLWLEDFYNYCCELGGETGEIMKELLEFEADRRAVEIVHNSIATRSEWNEPSHRGLRQELFCNFGKLYPICTGALPLSASAVGGTSSLNFTRVDNSAALAAAVEHHPIFAEALRVAANSRDTSLSQALKEAEVKLLKKAFDGQSHFAAFYAYVKLKLIELDNINSLSTMADQRGKYQGAAANIKARYISIF